MLGGIQRCDFGVGDTIDGIYRVEKILGEGTFGVVYAVTDDQGNHHALKLLRLWEVHPDIYDGLLKRFKMEYETGLIKSDYLVHSTCSGFVMGNPYIVMELCKGGDLVTLIEHGKQLNLSRVATHVLKGLEALHSNGKVHRDLKPENVLMKDNGIFALTDFGIAGDANNRLTQLSFPGRSAQMFGTYAYMPPEQYKKNRNATVLPTTDIFSFGVMMYQLITGELPFGPLSDESDVVAYMRRGRENDWDRSLLMRYPEGAKWRQLIEGCLVAKFEKRLQTVADILPLVPPEPKNKELSQPERAKATNDETPTLRDIPSNEPQFQTRIVRGVLLRIMQGDEYGRVFYLDDMLQGDRAIITVGRYDYGVKNDLPVVETTSSYISRKHCTLELDYNLGCWIIRDGQWDPQSTTGWRKSTNGTFVNSTEVDQFGMPFKPGDIISIGDTKFRAEGY